MRYLLLALFLSCATLKNANTEYVVDAAVAGELGNDFIAVNAAMVVKDLTLEQSAEWEAFVDKFQRVYVISAELYRICVTTNDESICGDAIDLVTALIPELQKHAAIAGVPLRAIKE